MIKSYQFRLLPTGEQSATLSYLLRYSCRLYNELLGMRIEAYQRGGSVSLYDQQREITHHRAHSETHKAVWRQFQQGVIRRLDKAYKAFFRGNAKFPKFQSIRKWKSLEIPQALVYGQGAVRIKGIGKIKCISRREITGRIKTAQIKQDAHGWRITIQAEVAEQARYAKTGKAVGLDVGIYQFIVTSAGEVVANQRLLQGSSCHLRISQRSLARKTKGSRGYKKAKRQVKQAHWKVAERRRGFHWGVIHKLLSRYDIIAVEKLKVANMVRNSRLARSINDVAWSGFLTRLACKAAEAGKQVIYVAPRNTSQECSGCGAVVKKPLSQRVHSCGCGVVLDRDHNAAINILKRAGISPPPAKVEGCLMPLGDALTALA